MVKVVGGRVRWEFKFSLQKQKQNNHYWVIDLPSNDTFCWWGGGGDSEMASTPFSEVFKHNYKPTSFQDTITALEVKSECTTSKVPFTTDIIRF